MYNRILRIMIVLITIYIYLQIDENFKVTYKINSKLNITKGWKSYLLSTIIFILGCIIAIWLTGSMLNMFTSIAASVILGLSICLSKKIVDDAQLTNKNI
ncbi:hypothetical protein [Clostridium saccharobutylicum]|uniref:Uncharacterized protein n=1 Tax=Clostridium saccharobutylicum TaxID=169679 RepID=A0A1S8NHQ7_CLOSA|nr:hypothetical protein [Clostridium saccharobutylicum]OOM15801.1 hypothetical protein CLOSAC_00720 [Clostridium saccharobutylicum]